MVGQAFGGNRLGRVIVRSSPGDRSRGVLVAGGLATPIALGRTGIGRQKREGDGHTPAGRFHVVAVMYRADRVRRPRTVLPVTIIRPDMGWCDDPADRNYNRPVRLPCPARHERMWRNDRLYDIVVVIDFNFARPRPGAGSAVFLHLARADFAPTEGCIALTETTMRRLLTHVGPRTILDVR